MIVVIADTSPLNYLVQIGCEPLLPTLFGKVLVPPAVVAELNHPNTPAVVREFLQHLPDWVAVSRNIDLAAGEELSRLHPGEREAIQLAQLERVDLLLMDERTGVRIARQLGLTVTGTLGVLIQGARQDLVDFEAALRLLQATEFRWTSRLVAHARQRLRSPTKVQATIEP